jgi:hypothetical protein
VFIFTNRLGHPLRMEKESCVAVFTTERIITNERDYLLVKSRSMRTTKSNTSTFRTFEFIRIRSRRW